MWAQVGAGETRATLGGYGRLGDVHASMGRGLLQSYYDPADWSTSSFYGLSRPYPGFYGLDGLQEGLTCVPHLPAADLTDGERVGLGRRVVLPSVRHGCPRRKRQRVKRRQTRANRLSFARAVWGGAPLTLSSGCPAAVTDSGGD